MTELVLIGAGGHGRSVIDVIESTNQFRIVAIIDKKENIGTGILNYSITHSDEDLASLKKPGRQFLVTVGQIKTPDPRIRLFDQLKSMGCELATVIASTAYVSKYAKVGPGTVVMHGAFINANAVVGTNCIVNTKALIEHDAEIADHCHISTGTIVNGGVIVESGSFVGSNAVIREGIVIPSRSIIPAGSAILKRFHAN